MQRHLDRISETDADTVRAPERPKLQISATTITAGAVASVSAALLGSTLGVAGTVAGAALGAVVSSVASAVYQHSVAATRYRMQTLRMTTGGPGWLAARRDVGVGQRSTGPGFHWDHWDDVVDSEATQEIPMGALLDATADRDAETGLASAAQPRPVRTPRNPRPPRRRGGWLDNWRGVLAGSLGAAFAFVLALLVVTGIESAKGAPLSGGTAGGLSVLGGGSYQNVGAGSAPDPSPVTVTVQQPASVTSGPSAGSLHTTTETVISTQTQTETETATATEIATDTATSEPTGPSRTSEPSDSGQSQPTTAPTTEAVTTPPPATSGAGSDLGSDASAGQGSTLAPSGRRP